MARRIRAIYDPQPAPSSPTMATTSDVEQMIARMTLLHERGFVFREHNIVLLAQLLREEGHTAEAITVSAFSR
jgi:hypothetical protein